MKRKLLIAFCALGMLGISSAYAQERSVENYPLNGGKYAGFTNATMVRVDAGKTSGWTGEENISYITVETTVPYYIAPSRITHPDWDPASGVINPMILGSTGTPLVFTSLFKMDLKDNPPTGTKADIAVFTAPKSLPDDHANKVMVEAKKLGEYTVTAQETSNSPAFQNCMDNAQLPEFKMRIISKPSVGFFKTKQMEQNATIHSMRVTEMPMYDAKGTYPEWLKNKKVLLLTTCNAELLNQTGKTMSLYVANTSPETWDEASTPDPSKIVPADYRQFAFSVRYVDINIDNAGNAQMTNPAMGAQEGTLAKTYNPKKDSYYKIPQLDQPGTTINIPLTGASAPSFTIAGTNRSMDRVYYLTSSEKNSKEIGTGEQGGVISLLSQRCSIDDSKTEDEQKYTTYPFGEYSIVVVRLSEKPITGPIYHIPNNLFIQ